MNAPGLIGTGGWIVILLILGVILAGMVVQFYRRNRAHEDTESIELPPRSVRERDDIKGDEI